MVKSIGLIMVLVMVFCVNPTMADVLKEINYQGQLIDNVSGSPVSGSVSMIVRIYDVETDGTALWEETHDTVAVAGGLYNVILGSVESLATVDFNQVLWFGVEVDGNGEMTPRQLLTSVSSAIHSGTAGSAFALDAPDGNPENAVYVADNGNVGIGTSAPSSKFVIDGEVEAVYDQANEEEQFISLDGDLWQSFTAGISGDFTSLEVRISSSNGNIYDLGIYSGEGTGGSLLLSDSITLGVDDWNHHELSHSVPIEAGMIYTISLDLSSGPEWEYTWGEEYPGGRASHDADSDFCFITYVSNPKTVMTVTDAGSVGIGQRNPAHPLDVTGDINVTGKYYENGSPLHSLDASDGSPSDALFVDADGKVGIGTTNPLRSLDVVGAARFSMDSAGLVIFPTDAAAYLDYSLPGASGTIVKYSFAGYNVKYYWNVGINTSFDPGYQLEVNGTAGKPGGGSWSDSSDQRLKTNIKTLDQEDALEKLLKLQGITYDWINPEEHDSDSHAGITAQNLESVFPDWVDETEPRGCDTDLIPDGDKSKTITYPHDFNAYLIESIRALNDQIQHLQKQNEILTQQNEDLNIRMEQLEREQR